MNSQPKTKAQLIKELNELCRRAASVDGSEDSNDGGWTTSVPDVKMDLHADKPMHARRRFIFLTLIMIVVSCVGMGSMMFILYDHRYEGHEKLLQTSVQSQVHLIEAVARYDRQWAEVLRAENPEHDAAAATLSQITDAREHYKGFGETGEFALARHDGDFIVFLLHHHSDDEHLLSVAFDSELAEPMRRALNGMSGIVTGLDYRGVMVLAAYEPVAELNLGIVAKIDLAEIRAPFLRSGLTAFVIALISIMVGTAQFFRISNPMIARLEAYSQVLEKEIEEHQRAEELRRYEKIVSSSNDMLALLDSRFIYLAANEAYLAAFGLGPNELIGHTAYEIFGDEIVETVIKPHAERCMAGEEVNFQEWMDFPAYGWRCMDIIYYPYIETGNKIEGFVVNARDITERKQAEEASARLNMQIEAKNKELAQIVYVASHDLRSPLVNIDGYGKELQDAINGLRDAFDSDNPPTAEIAAVSTLLSDDIPNALHYIRTSAAKMDALLTGLLKLSRSGRGALNIESLDMNELIGKMVDTYDFQIKEAGADLHVASLPPCEGDAVQVNQLFSNLLGNALQFLDLERAGVIRISGRTGEGQCVYSVEDNGIGIDPVHQQKIFEIFHRLDPAKGEGEGLGLTIVQQILGRLSGEIRLESTPGKGSRFYVSLPAVQKNH